MPGFVALLWLGRIPSWRVLVLSLATAVSGYTAIYAWNDLVGVDTDREKFVQPAFDTGYAVESASLRHPLAQGMLTYKEGLAWFSFWYACALIGAALLGTMLVVILVAATILEILYCRLLRVTAWRTVASGLVKSAGPLAAVFVVDPHPAGWSLLLLLAWLVSWEIGGQNIPADWHDRGEDARIRAKTIPLVLGPKAAGLVVVVTLTTCVVLSLFLPALSPLTLGWPYRLASGVLGCALLLLPASALLRSQEACDAARLFDRASLYPLGQLILVSVFVLLHRLH